MDAYSYMRIKKRKAVRMLKKAASVACVVALVGSLCSVSQIVAFAGGDAAAKNDVVSLEVGDDVGVGADGVAATDDGAESIEDAQEAQESADTTKDTDAAINAASSSSSLTKQAVALDTDDVDEGSNTDTPGDVSSDEPTLLAGVTEITTGGYYAVEPGMSSQIKISTPETVTLTTKGDNIGDMVMFNGGFTTEEGSTVNIVLKDFAVNVVDAGSMPTFLFGENTQNTVELVGDNAIENNREGSDAKSSTMTVFTVNQGSSLSFVGDGCLSMYQSASCRLAIGADSRDGLSSYPLNGDISFGKEGCTNGPTVAIYSSSDSAAAIGWYNTTIDSKTTSTTNTGYRDIDSSEDGEDVNVPGAINFYSGSCSIYSSKRMIGGGNKYCTKTIENFRINVYKDATVNFIGTGTGMTGSSIQAVPVGGGYLETSSTEQNELNATYDPQNPVTGGQMYIQSGASVRCWLKGGSETEPSGQPFITGYNSNIICMKIVSNSSDDSVMSESLIVHDLDLSNYSSPNGIYGISVDYGEEIIYDPSAQNTDYVFSSKIAEDLRPEVNPDVLSGINGLANYAPLYLTQENHIILINGEPYVFIYNKSTHVFATVATFAVDYDLNDDDGYDEYKAANSKENPTSVTSDQEIYTLEDPEREGFDFEGWYDASDIDFKNRIYEIDPSTLSANVSLVAKWKIKMLDVTFPYYEGGTRTEQLKYNALLKVGDEESYPVKESIKLSLPEGVTPDEGYSYIGYKPFYDEDGNLELVLRSGSVSEDCTVTLIATDSDGNNAAKYFKATVDVNGVNEEYTDTFKVKSGTSIKLSIYPKDGYTFEGCYSVLDVLDTGREPDQVELTEDGRNTGYYVIVRERLIIYASLVKVDAIATSISSDLSAEIDESCYDENGDWNGWRISGKVAYRITKVGLRYVQDEDTGNLTTEYVSEKDKGSGYYVWDGDPLCVGDVLTVEGKMIDGAHPDDVNMEYDGPVRFSINGDEQVLESGETYRVTGSEGGDIALVRDYDNAIVKTLISQGKLLGALTIEPIEPKLVQKTWLNVADTSWYKSNDSTFTITTPEQLAGMIKLMRGSDAVNFQGKTIVIDADISLANNDGVYDAEGNMGRRLWLCRELDDIGVDFAGTLDGGGHVISGLDMDLGKTSICEQNFGLISSASSATIKDLTVKGAISNPGNAEVFGGIVGACSKTTIENCTSYVSIEGLSVVGGIVGDAGSEVYVKGCKFLGAYLKNASNNGATGGIVGRVAGNSSPVTYVENCVNVVDLQGVGYVGGIVGKCEGNTARCEVKNSVNAGNITIGAETLSNDMEFMAGGIVGNGGMIRCVVEQCFNSGDITVGEAYTAKVGGILGYSKNPRLLNCGNTGDITVKIATERDLKNDKGGDITARRAQVGGIVGGLFGSGYGVLIDSCYSNAVLDIGNAGDDVIGGSNGLSGVGGLVGDDNCGDDSYLCIKNSYAAGELRWNGGTSASSGLDYSAGGLIGLVSSATYELHVDQEPEINDSGIYLINAYFVADAQTLDSLVCPPASADDASGEVSDLSVDNLADDSNDMDGLDESDDSGDVDESEDASSAPTRAIAFVGRIANPNDASTNYAEDYKGAESSDSLIQAVLALKDLDGESIYISDKTGFNGGYPLLAVQKMQLVNIVDSSGATLQTIKLPVGTIIRADYITQTYFNGEGPDFVNARAGYTYEFAGWSLTKDATHADDIFFMAYEGCFDTIYPVYATDAVVCTVTYVLDGGSMGKLSNPASYTVSTKKQNLNSPKKEGYKFLGWYEADGTKVESIGFTDKEVAAGGELDLRDLVLYAQWEEIPVEAAEQEPSSGDEDPSDGDNDGFAGGKSDGDDNGSHPAGSGTGTAAKTKAVSTTGSAAANTTKASTEKSQSATSDAGETTAAQQSAVSKAVSIATLIFLGCLIAAFLVPILVGAIRRRLALRSLEMLAFGKTDDTSDGDTQTAGLNLSNTFSYGKLF
jgi:uncharacterized repeat protein (TIGR02543 family)